MARVTVEDCIEVVPNRFDLVVLAAERAKNISSGALLTMERDNDKNPVIALREIAAKNIDIDALRESQIISLQKNNEVDDIPEENLYAEKKDFVSEEVDYASASEDDVFLSDTDLSTETDLDFSDNFTEEDK